MKYVSEFRDPVLVERGLEEIRRTITRPWVLMEICGGQTHAIVRSGLDQLLPPEIELVHGPGCPVCVTPLEQIDKALAIASRPEVIFTSYGDMLRVPGSGKDLFGVRAAGGDVRVVYSPLDAVRLAEDHPDRQVVFFAIGFETTAPANAMSVLQAQAKGLKNFSVLVSHVRVPPAIRAILGSPTNRVQGFLAAGHVCAVMGYWEYLPIARVVPHTRRRRLGSNRWTSSRGSLPLSGSSRGVGTSPRTPIRARSDRGRKPPGSGDHPNACSRRSIASGGIGTIPMSGWGLADEFEAFDAERRFQVEGIAPLKSPLCIAGQILQGMKRPHDCSAFGGECTPEHPLGATMVSSEGACAAYYRYGR